MLQFHLQSASAAADLWLIFDAMQTKEFFKELFEYTHHFNSELIKLLQESQKPFPAKSVRLINHTLNAHEIWNGRISDEPPSCGVWEIRELNRLTAIDRENYENTLRILNTVELTMEIEYKTSKGVPFTNSVKDILFHVVNHSTYHRGQIASDIKAVGIEPLSMDYIFYKR